jgi:hypothetical protein
MFLISGLSAMANTSGYDAYKSAWNNTKTVASLAAVADVTVTDNGANVFAGKANIKLNHGANAASVAATVGNGTETQTVNAYSQDGKLIFKSSADDVYRVAELGAAPWGSHRNNQDGQMQPPKAVGKVFDAFMGNMKELATLSNEPDGSKQASLHLSGSQIPAVVNALGTLIASSHSGDHGWHHGNGNGNKSDTPFFADPNLKASLPQLTDEIRVEAVNLDAKINPDNQLVGQSADIRISGLDKSGERHSLAIRLHVDFSGYNQTVPERIDLTGKPTEKIEHQWSNSNRGWKH